MRLAHSCSAMTLSLILPPMASAQMFVDAVSPCDPALDTCGTTWGTAYPDLGAALADLGTPVAPTEVWVAAGRYSGPIVLNDNVAMYGGFRGDETQLSDRDFRARRTLIVGGGPVVAITDTGSATVLDGFVVTGAMSTLTAEPRGGGLYLGQSAATVANCLFTRNYSGNLGGGIYIDAGAPTIRGCTFLDNEAFLAGGAIFRAREALVEIENCLFVNNKAGQGGGFAHTGNTGSAIKSCTFVENTATTGSAIAAPWDEVAIHNCILWGNWSEREGVVPIQNRADLSNSTKVQYSIIQDDAPGDGTVWPGVGNLDVDPSFAFDSGRNYRLGAGSPAIDAGDNTLVNMSIDLDGNPRTQDDPATTDTGVGTAPIVDIGAFEYDGRTLHKHEIARNRYLSIAPATSDVVAIRVTIVASKTFPALEGEAWWVQAPSSDWSTLKCFPVFRDWSGSTVLHIGSSQIVPATTYKIETVALGASLCDPASFSPPVLAQTVEVWGDLVGITGTGLWESLPDFQVTADDAAAIIDFINSDPNAPPRERCDVDPATPNNVVEIADFTVVQNASQGASYPYAAPAACAAGCNYGKCCGTNCVNTIQSACGGTWTLGVMCESEPDPCSGGPPCPPFCGE